MSIIIKNGRVIDPKNNVDEQLDVFIAKGKIKKIAKKINVDADRVIDAKGKIVCPGFIDIHVHFRTPGQEHKEDLVTGSMAAVTGGFTTVCPMPNTSPVIDNPLLLNDILKKAEQQSYIRILPVSAITKAMKNEQLVDVKSMLKNGCVGFSEDGKSVKNDNLMKEILRLSKKHNFPVICHCENPDFKDGVVNEGIASEKLGVNGIPVSVEDIIVERDINLAARTNGHAHITHTSSGNSIELIRKAKSKGINVTCDVTPHHFSLDDNSVLNGDANFKMNPPLRSKKDVDEIIKGIIDGTVDCIATDHAPHTEIEKNIHIQSAPFGVIGLETAFAVAVTFLLKPGHINLKRLIEMFTVNPARIINKDLGTLEKGKTADITVINLDKSEKINKGFFKSKSKNSPFINMDLYGFPEYTVFSGKLVFSNGKVIV